MRHNRTTVEFPRLDAELLASLCAHFETTKTEVIRRALSLFGAVTRETDGDKRRLAIVDEDGRLVKEILVL